MPFSPRFFYAVVFILCQMLFVCFWPCAESGFFGKVGVTECRVYTY